MPEHAPWSSGPGEILEHGIILFEKGSDSDRRIAMILVDNSVELTMKTYLGLPERITKVKISKKEYSVFSESFSKLLDAVEQYFPDKIRGIDLGEVEYYHRLRNELYHKGNGLSVESNIVKVYAELAYILFYNLFGFRLAISKRGDMKLLGMFMNAWVSFEKTLEGLFEESDGNSNHKFGESIHELYSRNVLSKDDVENINNIRKIRNEIVHGKLDFEKVVSEEIISTLDSITSKLKKTPSFGRRYVRI